MEETAEPACILKRARHRRGCGGIVSPAQDEMLRRELIALLPRLYRFALVLTKSPADADDLVQAT